MRKVFVPLMVVYACAIAPSKGAISKNMSAPIMERHVTYGDDDDAAKKEAAIKAVTEAAVKEAKVQLPAILKQGLESEETEGTLKAILNTVLKGMKVEDFDGEEKTLKTIFKSLQDQHDQLAAAFKEQGKGENKGSYIDFVEKNIAGNSDIKEDKYYSAKTTIKAAALMTTANVIPNVAGGFSPLFGNYIDTEIGHVPKPENVILPLITVKTQAGTEKIWYSDRINEEGDAEFIAEGSLKPLADAEWKSLSADVKEVAVRWKFTKRLMNHAPAVVADFLEHAYELVEQKIDDQLLDGDGIGNNLTGLEEVAGTFVVPAQLAGYYAFANIWDVINAMATRIRLNNFRGQLTAVLNTVWEAKMKGIKTTYGEYITPPFVSPDGKRVGSVQIVFSNKIDDDSILIGELKRFNLVMAEGIEYDEGYENDDFSKNLVSRKLEAFMGTYIKASHAGSIIYASIASVLDDIAVPEV